MHLFGARWFGHALLPSLKASKIVHLRGGTIIASYRQRVFVRC